MLQWKRKVPRRCRLAAVAGHEDLRRQSADTCRGNRSRGTAMNTEFQVRLPLRKNVSSGKELTYFKVVFASLIEF
jgi:hypothetical protein